MKCPQCGKDKLLIEGLGEGKIKLTCQACSFQTVKDEKGRGLLIDTMPPRDRCQLLIG